MTTSALTIDAGLAAAGNLSGLRVEIVELLDRAMHMASTLDEDVAALHIQWAIDILAGPISALAL